VTLAKEGGGCTGPRACPAGQCSRDSSRDAPRRRLGIQRTAVRREKVGANESPSRLGPRGKFRATPLEPPGSAQAYPWCRFRPCADRGSPRPVHDRRECAAIHEILRGSLHRSGRPATTPAKCPAADLIDAEIGGCYPGAANPHTRCNGVPVQCWHTFSPRRRECRFQEERPERLSAARALLRAISRSPPGWRWPPSDRAQSRANDESEPRCTPAGSGRQG